MFEGKRIAVFASGSGSNFAAITEACQSGLIRGGKVVRLVCDKPGAYVLERAKTYEVPAFVFQPKDYAGKEAFEQEILSVLQRDGVDLIVLAGYMRLVGQVLLQAFDKKIINLHPSLLPSFTGKDAIGQALDYGVKVTGVTIHLVDAGLDTGPIIAQQTVSLSEGESRDTLAEKIHTVEHELLPRVIQWLVEGRVICEGRKVLVEMKGEEA